MGATKHRSRAPRSRSLPSTVLCVLTWVSIHFRLNELGKSYRGLEEGLAPFKKRPVVRPQSRGVGAEAKFSCKPSCSVWMACPGANDSTWGHQDVHISVETQGSFICGCSVWVSEAELLGFLG